MKIAIRETRFVTTIFLLLTMLFSLNSGAQQPAGTVVPTLVKFNGTLTDLNGKATTGTVGITIYLYRDEQGGAPLWMETQNVTPGRIGHYTAGLGSAIREGRPTDRFAS